MPISVAEAARQLESRGLLERWRTDQSERIIDLVSALIGRDIPRDLADFYRERIRYIVQYSSILPVWNSYVGWRMPGDDLTRFLHHDVIPLFSDGCGSRFVLDLTPGVEVPAVYFIDHAEEDKGPNYAVGSSLGRFLLLAGDHDRAFDEAWPEKWELTIDPDLVSCPRAPAIWATQAFRGMD